jgi:hypothetical protein
MNPHVARSISQFIGRCTAAPRIPFTVSGGLGPASVRAYIDERLPDAIGPRTRVGSAGALSIEGAAARRGWPSYQAA